ncbi:hypothetical protein HI914_01796 [Erysiphe necator]|nr:hypothetical protein HI914_01796 [Erysiphe necator]
MFLAILSLFLWIDQGLILPWFSNQEEIERQKMNNWWLQVYREERKTSHPTGILRHRRNSSYSTENYINAIGDTYPVFEAPTSSSKILAVEKLQSKWENKVTKHVRFELPLNTISTISVVLGEENDDSMTTGDLRSCRYDVKTWDFLTSFI